MKHRIKNILTILLILCLVGLWGCGGEKEPAADKDPVAAQTGYQLVSGKTLQLTSTLAGDVQWSSSQPQWASVDENGLVTALQDRGQVTVTANNGQNTEAFTVSLCQETQYGAVSLPASEKPLTIGAWNGSYHEIDEFRMELLADAGISLLVGIDPQWVVDSTMTEFLDTAYDYGISIIVDLRSWDGVTVPEYAEHPALAGFLMYDEPCATEFEKLAQTKQQFDAVMPEGSVFYVNIFPMACSYESLFGDPYDPSCVDYEKYYSNLFVDTVQPSMLSVDTYPLQDGGYIRATYVKGFDVLRHKAQQSQIPFWHTLNTSGHSTTDGRYCDPTPEQLRWQMCMGMTYGADHLLHYVLASHDTQDYTCILEYSSWDTTEIYDHVSLVDSEFLAWQDIYMSYDWVGTVKVDVGKENPLLYLKYDLPMEEAGMLTEVNSQQDLLIGVFEKDGQNGYMITNAGDSTESNLWLRLNFTCEDTQVELQLAEGSYRCAAVITNGQIQYVPVSSNNTVSLTVEAMNGAFVIPIIS